MEYWDKDAFYIPGTTYEALVRRGTHHRHWLNKLRKDLQTLWSGRNMQATANLVALRPRRFSWATLLHSN